MKLELNSEQFKFLSFIIQDFEYNDETERKMIEQLEFKLYKADVSKTLESNKGLLEHSFYN